MVSDGVIIQEEIPRLKKVTYFQRLHVDSQFIQWKIIDETQFLEIAIPTDKDAVPSNILKAINVNHLLINDYLRE